MNARPELSVVVATYCRAETLRETLRCLAEQTLDPGRYEVIVIDDGSPDNTAQVVSAFQAASPFELLYLRHENRGPGYTQNRGIEAARADIVLLMADDIFMQPQALAAHLRQHREQPEESAVVLGRTMQSPLLTETVFLRTWDPFRFRALAGMKELPWYYFWACNISLKRGFIVANGMFRGHKGRAGAAAHEDVELGYRLHRRGMRLYYAEDALGHHCHVETLEGAMKRSWERGMNFDEFRRFVPEPDVVVRYHVLAWHTLGDHWRALTGPRRVHLLPHDRNPLLLSMRYLLRALVFNRFTVKGLWLPLLNGAEHSSLLACFVHRTLYRGVISWSFAQGCRDAVKRWGAFRPDTRAAG